MDIFLEQDIRLVPNEKPYKDGSYGYKKVIKNIWEVPLWSDMLNTIVSPIRFRVGNYFIDIPVTDIKPSDLGPHHRPYVRRSSESAKKLHRLKQMNDVEQALKFVQEKYK